MKLNGPAPVLTVSMNGTITTTQPVLFWVFERQWRLDEKGLRKWTRPPGRLPVISACGNDEARCSGRPVFVRMLGKVFRVDNRGVHECVRPDPDSPVSSEAVETYLADSQPEPIKDTAPVNNPRRLTKEQAKAGMTQERLDQLYYRTIAQTAEDLWKTTGTIRSLIKKRKLRTVRWRGSLRITRDEIFRFMQVEQERIVRTKGWWALWPSKHRQAMFGR